MNFNFFFLLIMCVLLFSCQKKDGEFYYAKGNYFFNMDEFEKAIEEYSKGILLNDEFVQSNYSGRGRAYREVEKFDLAIEDIQTVLKTERSNSKKLNRNAYWDLAWIAEAKGQKFREIELYKKALKYDPKNNKLKMTYALVLIDNNEAFKGVSILDELIADQYEGSYIFNNRALGLIKLERYEEAKIDLDKSFGIDKFNPFLHRNYFYFYKDTNQLELACQSIEKALSLDVMKYGLRKHIQEFENLKADYCN